MAPYRSDRADSIWLAVGVLAAVLALAECVAAIILVNRPALADAIGVSEWGVIWVTIGAIVAMILVVVSVLVGFTPRRGSVE